MQTNNISKDFRGDRSALEHLSKVSHDLFDDADLDPLIEKIADARYVLLGEASHGTHEYYTWRARISKRLIKEKGFSFIAVEGDWPDCYRINRFVKGYREVGIDARHVMNAFNRWPTWMWGNWEVIALAEWLHKYNNDLKHGRKVGFYGLDVYSLWESLEALVKYLKNEDPETLRIAESVISCFQPYSHDEGRSYARASYRLPGPCEEETVALLSRVRKNLFHYDSDPEAALNSEQNASVAVNAERYYRVMLKAGSESWNVRDRHMTETLNRIMKFHGDDSKAIIWEHNTHIGDARATDMRNEDMVNVGQLVHEQHRDEGVIRVGFGSYQGTVIAGSEWGDRMKVMKVPPAPQGTWEYMLHHCGKKSSLIITSDLWQHPFFNEFIGHRAIGVVYRPEYEKLGNYVPSIIPQRYEAFIFLDETHALHALDLTPDGQQVPETYPWGA